MLEFICDIHNISIPIETQIMYFNNCEYFTSVIFHGQIMSSNIFVIYNHARVRGP